MDDTIPDMGFICHACACQLGGKWPEGHVATSHVGKCCVCGNEKGLVNVGDYDWPDKKARGMRD